jgi:uncharacterized protein YaeQ
MALDIEQGKGRGGSRNGYVPVERVELILDWWETNKKANKEAWIEAGEPEEAFVESMLGFDVDEEETLAATVYPENATDKGLTWMSSDPSVVSVNNGKIKTLNEGCATITVATKDGHRTASLEVRVAGSIE